MSSTDPAEDIERIRQAKNGEEDTGDGPEIFTCPVEGCSRVVIDNPGDLRNHVHQSSGDTHRYKTLNDDLEVKTEWGKMNWDPGLAPKSD